jgi:hypothetical protein
MATRAIRLDDEAEAALAYIRKAIGFEVSGILKRGLRALQERLERESAARRTTSTASRTSGRDVI